MRGKIIKTENRKELRLKRNFLTRTYVLSLNKRLCNGCGLCAEICPKDSIRIIPAEIADECLIKKATIDFDVSSCVLCGECAVLCPLNALTMEVDGKEKSVIVKNEAFPVLNKEIKVVSEKCDPDCGLVCQSECPFEAIKILTKVAEDEERLEIIDVQIDESLCCYCERCELICPRAAIEVKKPYQGKVYLQTDLCPENCRICVDACPTKAIKMENEKPVVMSQFCIFCSACQNVCPKDAISVCRVWVFHTDIKAAAWLTALKKLTSFETVMKELRIKSGRKRSSLVRNRTMRSPSNKPEQPISTQAIAFMELLEKFKQ